MKYSEDDKNRIIEAADNNLLKVISSFITLEKRGSDYVGKCPMCGEPRGLHYTEGKKIFKCFHCNELKGNNAVTLLMKGFNKTFPEALEDLGNLFGIYLPIQDQSKEVKEATVSKVNNKKKGRKSKGESLDSYCARMLAESGLTFEDVTAKVYKSDEKSTIFECKTFHAGTVSPKGEIDNTGDDAIIEYYDLAGFPVKYDVLDAKGRATTEKKSYFRVRWQYPDEHKNKDSKPTKYRSPRGSGTPIYIPERLRKMYNAGTEIPRLYIQEGEKKAEASCKYDIPSIAISGIQNLGQKGALPEDLIRIIQKCSVHEVVLLFDSDWNDIGEHIKLSDAVDQRPRNFFYAARNYKEYMRSLKNREIFVEIFIGHVNKNEAGDKGIDDLLANTLKGKEKELAEDIEYAINEKNKEGKYCTFFQITSHSDHKLEELWSLNNPKKFAEAHRDILRNLPEFKLGRHLWKFSPDGELESAQPLESDETFWREIEKTKRDGTSYTEYEFRYVRSRIFLQNHGFGRFRQIDNQFCFIHLTPPFVREILPSDARDFLFEFTEVNCKEEINEMISKGVSQYVGPDKLSLLKFIFPNFIPSTRDEQFFYFGQQCWKVSQTSVVESGYEQISHHIWIDQMRKFKAAYIGSPLIQFQD